MSTLVDYARRTGFAFETSPSGRWVRLHLGSREAYVVEGAWGNSYLVWAGEGPTNADVERFRCPEEALRAVLRLSA